MVIRSKGFDRPFSTVKRGPAPHNEPANALDERVVLDVLDRVRRLGESYQAAGEAHGLSRGAVAGLVKRMMDACAAEDARPLLRGERPVSKPENMDGGMPALWWKPGLAARRRTA